MAYGPPAQRDGTAAALAWLNRQNFAFPPDHGARVVTTILTDAELRADWQAELDVMRLRLQDNRAALANALVAATDGTPAFGALARQSGMFSLLPLSSVQIEALRTDHAIYLIGDGRINLAGINDLTLPRVVAAVAEVWRGA
ncbi:Aminotransferase class I and II [Roseicitreum antarcticum]|uniref:Aminotransferase class I and II n=1 Tax=Roseicitreum antarcticum TaxID=564137 RepID=A0A1H2VL82_9RHOB|nr:aminotransferase class I/II-fold pyridoxal phosphate-dependent enzyme [Roseicitreum antarcticum]SDW69028.1 Aminotransferase class I and II [Roseicitreum antarcticum]